MEFKSNKDKKNKKKKIITLFPDKIVVKIKKGGINGKITK